MKRTKENLELFEYGLGIKNILVLFIIWIRWFEDEIHGLDNSYCKLTREMVEKMQNVTILKSIGITVRSYL